MNLSQRSDQRLHHLQGFFNRNSSASVNEVITPSNLNFAVKSALSDDRRISDMTDEEKANARGVIGALGASVLDDYYTKSQVDSKLSSVYKYQGTVSTALELVYKTPKQGDVYNCLVNGAFYPSSKVGSAKIVSIVSDTAHNKITLTFDAADALSTIWAGDELVISNVYIATSESHDNGFVYGDVVDGTTNSITVDYSKYVQSLTGAFADINPVSYFDYYGNQTLEAGGTLTTVHFAGALKPYYTSGSAIQTVNEGTNVAWTGTDWDELGTTIDISAKADKATTIAGYGITDAYTKTEVDGKIAAAIETALNTEV